jgi:hypothetical protein
VKTYHPADTIKVATAALNALAVKNRRNYVHEFYKVEIDLEMANVLLSSPISSVEIVLNENNSAWNIDGEFVADTPAEAGKKAAEILRKR